jgi:hypothetical protein
VRARVCVCVCALVCMCVCACVCVCVRAHLHCHCTHLRLLGPESRLTVKAHCEGEKAILGDNNIFSRPSNLTNSDGGDGLRKERAEAYPESAQMACATHFRKELLRKHTSEADKKIFERILRIPKNQQAAAEYLYSQLSPDSHVRHGRPKEELFPVFMRKGVLA